MPAKLKNSQWLFMFAGGNLAFLWRSVLEREGSTGDLVLGGIDRLELFIPLRRKNVSAQLAMIWSEIC